jgi:hypothetical protein
MDQPTTNRSRGSPSPKKLEIALLRSWWREHIGPLLAYLALSMALTWPLIRDFSTAIIGVDETRHNLWILWHVKQALLGHEPLFHTSLLYYPLGISLLTHSSGPVQGLFALPFWALGPAAAYNGAILVSFSLTGYFMYLLARGLNLERSISLFAGTMFLAAPIHLGFLYVGHLGQMFVGTLPLTLLAVHHALNLDHNRWWTVLPAFALLLTLLDAAWNFTSAGIGAGCFIVITLIFAKREHRRALLQRSALIALASLAVTGPLLLASFAAASNPAISASRNLTSFAYQPDLIQFFFPATSTSRFFGPLFAGFLTPYVSWGHETAVFVTWTGFLLSSLALIFARKAARRWLLLVLFFFLLSLGPTLKVFGETHFTEYELPIILPYAFLTSLPGLDVIRTPGRFMQIGFVGLAATSSFGLAWLHRQLPNKLRYVATAAAVALVLLESWPQSYPQEELRPVPEFYRRISEDDEMYGVFDLPIRPFQKREFHSSYIQYSAYYQMYQMTHGKGIATGYISRQYDVHPLFGQFISDAISDFPLQHNILVNGKPADRYANVQFELARHGYRYVVFHKPQDGYPDYKKGSWGELKAREFIREVFGQQEPVVDDELVTVYTVDPITDTTRLITTIALRDGENWAVSPATFYVASPRPDLAHLEVTPAQIYDSQAGTISDEGLLTLQSASGISASTKVGTHQTATLPLLLAPGSQVVTLTLHSGKSQSTSDDSGDMNFAIGSINLQTRLPMRDDILVDGHPQQSGGGQILAGYGTGWYAPESWDDSGSTWRWAASPAQLFIHSSEPRQVRITSVPGSLHEPNSTSGVGTHGVLLITANDQVPQQLAVQVGQPLTTDVMLQAGWNCITLALEAGNFRPMDVQPGNGDARLLSFALREINILAR